MTSGAGDDKARKDTELIGALQREVRDLRAANSALSGGEVDAVVAGDGALLLRGAQESLGRLAAIVESLDDAIYSVTLDGTVLTWNPGAERLLGYAASEIVGRDVAMLVPPEEEAARRESLERARNGEGSAAVETERVRKDGTRIPVARTMWPIRGPGGGVTGAAVVLRDISGHRRAEEAAREAERLLRKSEAKYRSLVETSMDLIWSIDAEGVVTYMNGASVEFYGYEPSELIGRPLWALVPEEELAAEKAAFQRPFADGGPIIDRESAWRHRDGHTVFSLSNCVAERDADGRVVAVSGTSKNVTEWKRANEELRATTNHTRALEGQLLQAQKMEAVGRLAGGVAHDFNNHLTAILGYAELLLASDKLETGVREELREIQLAAERAAALTRQLLAFSRKQVLLPEILDLGGVVRGLYRMLERLIGEDIRISVVAVPDLWAVEADPGQIEQVVMNLAVNARDAMPSGGNLTLEIRNVELDEAGALTAGAPGPGAWVLLSVADTGTGIPPDVRSRIFEPFFTTKEKGKGTGLGLSTVLGIVAQSGGGVTVSSEPGRGTTFRVYLPRALKMHASRSVSAASRPAVRGTGTILLVEDQPQVRHLARRLLEKAGFIVLEAADADAALKAARTHEGAIDLLLTDVVMPGAGGRELASSLRRERPNLRVLLMSGYTDDGIVDITGLEPGTAFIQKPFSPQALTMKVHEVLGAPV